MEQKQNKDPIELMMEKEERIMRLMDLNMQWVYKDSNANLINEKMFGDLKSEFTK